MPPPLAGLPEYYRNRAVLHVAQNNGMSIGFFNHLTHRICAVEKCLLLRRELNELLALLREVLPRHADALPQLRNLVLRCNGDGTELLLTLVGECQLSAAEDLAAALMRREPRLASVWVNTGPPLYGIYGGEWRRLAGAEQLNERIGPLRLRLSPASFLQVNCQLILPLYRLARDFAGISRHERAFDLYSGVGSIALYLAPDSERVCGIENYAPAVADAKENAVLNGIDNCRFIAGAAEDSLPQLAGSGERADVLVVDPPRAGCAKRVVDAIITMRPRRIVYVSCDPATLARDVRLLAAAGYQVTKVQPVDMFPRTPHVECVVLMSRVDK
ncbi:MAG: 23S rRNA (uracil-C(5))-methyltransferase RlmCD [Pelotomaculum sp. PtaB.Bin104]|nr:MAG: 23S rRNA (uracil-C(5))-methyltransferase RlmCD [Pelotomaculum sp. PtaB.Bin104]